MVGGSVGAEDGGSVAISSVAEDEAVAEDASGSLDGGAVAWIFVEEADGEEAWGVRSVSSTQPTKVKHRIKVRISGNKRFMMFTSSFFFGLIYAVILLKGGSLSLAVRLRHSLEVR